MRLRRARRIVAPGRRAGLSIPGQSGVAASATRLVVVVCAAQVLVQIGAFFWPALLPRMVALWGLSYSEAGWITAAFYGAYIVAVPVLVTLTDRVDPKIIYLFGVSLTVAGHALFALTADGFWSAFGARSLTGIGWAGTYMTGLKLLADSVDGKLMSRATAGHAASIGIAGALSFASADFLAARRRVERRLLRRRRKRAPGVARRMLCGPAGTVSRAAAERRCGFRFPPRAAQSLGHGIRDRLRHTHARDERAARMGRRLPGFRRDRDWDVSGRAFAGGGADRAGTRRHRRQHPRQRGRNALGPPASHRVRLDRLDALCLPARACRPELVSPRGVAAPSLWPYRVARIHPR